MKNLIVIPARYGSKRLPGKPLRLIAGQSLVQRVYRVAKKAAEIVPDTEVVIATDDKRISNHCDSFGAKSVMTSTSCRSGSDRTFEAANKLNSRAEIIVNFQGDSPFTPPNTIVKIINEFNSDPKISVVTPAEQLSWKDLDKFRNNKKISPFSGTTVVLDKHKNALWFSKQVLPAIRKEEKQRKEKKLSPVFRHIGLYAYRYQALKDYTTLDKSNYETLEGLEQLRFLENGHCIRAVILDLQGQASMSGIDSEEDIARAEALIAKYGDQ